MAGTSFKGPVYIYDADADKDADTVSGIKSIDLANDQMVVMSRDGTMKTYTLTEAS